MHHLRLAYKRHRVKLKRIKIRRAWRRPDDVKNIAKDREMFEVLHQEVQHVVDNDLDFIMADEVIFHQRQVVKTAFAAKGFNVEPKVMLKPEPCTALVGAMSVKHGFLHHLMRPKSIKSDSFLVFLKELRAKVDGKVHVLLDNASIHKTKVVRAWAEENEFTLVWNQAYSP